MSMTIWEVFLLHARADRVVRSAVAVELDKFQLTMMEWLLLGVVVNAPKEGVSMSAAAQALDVTLPQITALANKLLALKLIRQKTQTHDRRSRHIMPTGKGKTVLEDIDTSLTQTVRDWVSSLPKDQLGEYMKTVEWLATHKYTESEES